MDVVHGGELVARALAAQGVDTIYTLCGGHIAPIYDGCLNNEIEIIDFRHEQAAAHAADHYGRTGAFGVEGGPARRVAPQRLRGEVLGQEGPRQEDPAARGIAAHAPDHVDRLQTEAELDTQAPHLLGAPLDGLWLDVVLPGGSEGEGSGQVARAGQAL